ncbi:MAG TPA: hypothetical protein VMU80_28265 [Bryobacteraceae bacterium]|nr:hypothetical protein [Bryobacteraceae bacterium]HUO33143.1 hypothetical protein [Bryobacteraceae bacterium]
MGGRILVRGDGIAASGCIRLLRQAGLSVAVDGPFRPKLPAIMISEATQKLLQDVFARPDLFEGLSHVRRRVVAWGPGAKPVVLPHSAVVTSEEALLRHIPQPALSESPGCSETDVAWTVFAARPLPETVEERNFGSRVANVAQVKLQPESPPETCWIESLDDGWLFLLPTGKCAWLLSVGGPVESQLARSRVIADEVLEILAQGSSFPSHPRIAGSLCSDQWLACGTAALAFDPLCGEGAGNAAREAILASAVIRAAVAGEDVNAVTAHYTSRLMAGFRKHLAVCHDFYSSGGTSPWWEEQRQATRRGIEWCDSILARGAKPRYRLNGFVLETLGHYSVTKT